VHRHFLRFFPDAWHEASSGTLVCGTGIPGGWSPVVISYRFWKNELAGDQQVIGRFLNLDNTGGMTVIGVMPPVPDWFPDTDIWAKNVPSFSWIRLRGNKLLTVIGRLKPGFAREQAEQELTTILHRGAGESPETSVELVPLKDQIVGNVRTGIEIVMGAVGFVLKPRFAAVHVVIGRIIRGLGSDSRGDWDLRNDCVLRESTHARDGFAHGARGPSSGRALPSVMAGAGDRIPRLAIRRVDDARDDAVHDELALRRDRDRSDHVCGCGDFVNSRCVGSMLYPRASRYARRSDGGTEV